MISFDQQLNDDFRYGLSITFFIIIGDQLDRCMSRNERTM